ncbi:hypothetical protein FY034_18525 (plasmid) [Trichlorobacter lovleyi]|nr:hypothetical protein FY034_18525 [Trichlorobacter lovleyi]
MRSVFLIGVINPASSKDQSLVERRDLEVESSLLTAAAGSQGSWSIGICFFDADCIPLEMGLRQWIIGTFGGKSGTIRGDSGLMTVQSASLFAIAAA